MAEAVSSLSSRRWPQPRSIGVLAAIAIFALAVAAAALFAIGSPETPTLVRSLGLIGVLGLGLCLMLMGLRAQVMSVHQKLMRAYHGPALITANDGTVVMANAVASAQFGVKRGDSLGIVLTQISGEGPGQVTALADAALRHGAAAAALRTGVGTRHLTAVSIGRSRLIWLIDPTANADLALAGLGDLPAFSVEPGGAVTAFNGALVELIGRSPTRIDDIVADPPLRPGHIHALAGATGAVIIGSGRDRDGKGQFHAMPCDPQVIAASASSVFFDALPVALVRIKSTGEVVVANSMARELLCHSMNGRISFDSLVEGLGRSVSGWLREAARGTATRKAEVVRATMPEGDVYLQVTLHRVGARGADELIAVLIDATELKTLEKQFVQSQKMQAIGQLAGGVAHDFNNLLTAISGHCDLLLLRHDEGDPEYADLVQIHQNANRAASLVGQLLAFSRKQHLRPERLDLRDALSDLGHLLNRLVGERVTILQSHDPDLAAVRADRRQLEQVIMNLVVNARDAMPEGGEITIQTRNMDLRDDLRRERAIVPRGKYIVISISDTGCGIPKDRLNKVFEPFWTTKRPGEGTGLGLSTVYGIVKQTGGFIFVDSELGKGTTFEVLLPATEDTAAVAKPAGPEPTVRHGEGIVLLVEDEAPVRAFAARALQMRGYRVIEAESGEQALELLADPSLKVDVFVTDVVMPGLDGPSWVGTALAQRPDVNVVFISGYAEDALAEHQDRFRGAAFLAKPFSLNELTSTVLQQMR